MTRILITGAQGMLGRDLLEVFSDCETLGLSRNELDIRDADSVLTATAGFDIVINAAAYTQVDNAEFDEAAAWAVNGKGPQNLAAAAKFYGTRLVQISTDYVFDGRASEPYSEYALTNPLSAYGRTKEAGERAVLETYPDGSLIVRTSWLYGLHGSSFPKSIINAGRRKENLDVVDDQIGQPTWTKDVARMVHSLVDLDVNSGIFHATNSGSTSWFGFAKNLFELARWNPDRILPVSSSAFARDAPRPAWSVLGHAEWLRHGLPVPRPWDKALEDAWQAQLHVLLEEDSSEK
jgi:dTDP-4-dehydrorhamnose reductase